MNAPLTPIPPLENGDRLTRDEFERRYHAMPHVKKAELIEGVVYMPSPIRFVSHSKPHGQLITMLGNFAMHTPGVEFGGNASVRLDLKNEPQPDALMLIEAACGGRTCLDKDGYVSGGPELAVEIAASTSSIDLGDKKKAYRRNGAQEYLVWRVFDTAIDWFVLRKAKYVAIEPDADGICRSTQFSGLWLDLPALLGGDFLAADAALRRGLESAEHAAFVAKLRAARGSR